MKSYGSNGFPVTIACHAREALVRQLGDDDRSPHGRHILHKSLPVLVDLRC